MRTRFPSPAVVLSSLALLFSLSGTALAGVLITGANIKNNTVGTLDLKNDDVRSIDVRNNSLTSLDVLNGSLKAVDFAPGQLKPGPAGPAGAQGPAGPQGAPGLAGLEVVSAESGSSSDPARQVDVSCPAGKQVVGGGAQLWNAGGDVALDESYPAAGNKWRATAYEVNATAANWRLQVFAICAAVAA